MTDYEVVKEIEVLREFVLEYVQILEDILIKSLQMILQ